MNLHELAKETKELKEDVKREKRNFNAKIKPKKKEYKIKEKTIRNYLKEALNEYEYRNLEVKPIRKWYPNEKVTIKYPFIKFKDIYVKEYESFEVKKENNLEMICHSYALRNKENGKLIEVKESAVLNVIIRGIIFRIKVEEMEFDIVKDFDI